MNKTCKRCILNNNYPNISFDQQGICNYCNHFDKYKEDIENKKYLKKIFKERLKTQKGKYDYDCLVGISGGKDSSYILYMLKEKYNLKILSYTYDNGFLSDYAKKNIKNLIEKTDVDHFFYKIDWKLQKKLYKKMMDKFGIPCKACSLATYGTSFKFAFEKKIPFVIHGRTPSQIFREFIPESKDPTIPFIKNNMKPYNKELQRKTIIQVAEKISTLLSDHQNKDKKLSQKVLKLFFPDIKDILKSDLIPEFLGFFMYHDYDEKQIKDTLEKKLNWKRPQNDNTFTHRDCLIHDAVEYLRIKKHGYTLLEPEISVQIRQNKIPRKQAIKRVKQEKNIKTKPVESIKILCNELDIDHDSFIKFLKQRDD